MSKKTDLVVSDLVDNPRNPRVITDSASSGLSHSIRLFGDISGITFNRRTNRLVCGHQRMTQLRKKFGDGLSLERIPGNSVEGEEFYSLMVGPTDENPSGMRFPVRVVDWDEVIEYEANITANNKSLMGTFSQELLLPMLEEIKQEDEDSFQNLLLKDLMPLDWGTDALKVSQEKEVAYDKYKDPMKIIIHCSLADVDIFKRIVEKALTENGLVGKIEIK